MNARQLLEDMQRFPWRTTALTLGERFREDRLGLTASSLTFTTTIALVPFFTVVLAVFTAFPMFAKLQGAVQTWLVQSLIPDAIARQVLGYITQFAGRASTLGAAGVGVLFVTALSLVLTIDRTLNNIWRVKRPRPLAQRVLVYWAVLTLGPLLLAASLSVSSFLISSSRGLIHAVPAVVRVTIDLVELLLLAAGLAALYRYVPNAPVRRTHAWAGGVFATVGTEIARRLLAVYIGKVPTYSVVYGAFATLPIFLVWIYVVWLVILMGAVVAAYLPSLIAGTRRRAAAHGWQFQLALEVLQALAVARSGARRGLSMPQLVEQLEVDALQLEPVVDTLVTLDWIGRLNEVQDEAETRFLLLADPQSTALEPLMRQLLLPSSEATRKLWQSGGLSRLYLKDVL